MQRNNAASAQLELFRLPPPRPRDANPTQRPTRRGVGCVLRHCGKDVSTLDCACIKALPEDLQGAFKAAFDDREQGPEERRQQAEDYWWDVVVACRQMLRELLGPERRR
ncbi:MAG: hypothetical protein IV100_12485 [Myxococcales bacterium]|nr:hypothetical protein [Myxococcales bacterium]